MVMFCCYIWQYSFIVFFKLFRYRSMVKKGMYKGFLVHMYQIRYLFYISISILIKRTVLCLGLVIDDLMQIYQIL